MEADDAGGQVCTGIWSHVCPSKRRPVRFLFTPSHCLKKISPVVCGKHDKGLGRVHRKIPPIGARRDWIH